MKKCELLSHIELFVTPWNVARQTPLSMGFSRQGYWSRLPFPFPGDLLNPGIEPASPVIPAFKHILYPWTIKRSPNTLNSSLNLPVNCFHSVIRVEITTASLGCYYKPKIYMTLSKEIRPFNSKSCIFKNIYMLFLQRYFIYKEFQKSSNLLLYFKRLFCHR